MNNLKLALIEFRKILSETQNFHKKGLSFLLLLIVGKLLNSVSPFLIKLIIKDPMHEAIGIGILFFILKSLSPVFNYFGFCISVYWMKVASFSYWNNHYQTYWKQTLADLETNGGYAQIDTIKFGINSIRFIVGGLLVRFIPIGLDIIFSLLLIAITVSIYVALVLGILLLAYALVLIFSKSIEVVLATKNEIEMIAKQSGKAHQAFLATSFIKSFNLEQTILNRSVEDYTVELGYQDSSKKMSLKAEFVQQLLLGISSGLVFILGVRMLLQNSINIGDFALIMLVWSQATGPFVQLSWLWREGVISLTQFQHANEQNEKNKIIYNPLVSNYKKQNFLSVKLKPVATRMVFDEFDLKFVQGKHYLLYGSVGAGKSILLKSSLGHYPVEYGEVSIPEGQQTLLIAQGSHPFGYSLLDCLTLCNQRSWNETQISQLVLELGLPEKSLLEPWGDSYCPFSGGQRSLVLLACAILTQPQFLFLDEVTSALDFKTEKNAYAVLQKYLPDTALILVAHRLHNALWVDYAFGLNEGRIVEEGTVEKLLGTSSLLADLLSQATKIE